MKKIIYFFILIVSFFSLSSCNKWKVVEGNGEYITREYNALEATSLTVNNIQINSGDSIIPVYLYLKSSETKKIEIVGQENIINGLELSVSFDELKISGKSRTKYKTDYLRIYLYGYKLNDLDLSLVTGFVDGYVLEENAEVSLSAASSLTVNNHIGKKLSLLLQSSSEFIMNNSSVTKIDAKLSSASSFLSSYLIAEKTVFEASSRSEVKIDTLIVNDASFTASSSSNINVEGEASSLDLSISGGSLFEGESFNTEHVTIGSISGKSSIFIYASKSINIIAASGQSKVLYYGDPSVTEGIITGDALIKKGE